jgi:hypothetical protein
MMLLTISLLALVAAAGFAAYAWQVLRDDRVRSNARVAALGSAALDEDATEVLLTPPAAAAATTLFDKRPSMRGHPLVRVGVGFAMSVALIVFIAMGSNRHEEPDAAAPAVVAQQDARLELLSMHPERSGDTLTVTGLVRNAGRGAAKGVTAVVFAFDRDGDFVASGRAPLDFVTLGPGDDSPFRVTVPQVGDVARYRVSFRDDAGVVRHVDRRPALQARAR